MYGGSLLTALGLWLCVLVACSTTMPLPQVQSLDRLSTTTKDSHDLHELTAKYSIPKIALQTTRNLALSRRKYKDVPSLPLGWKARFGTTTAMLPVIMTAGQLSNFYVQVARAALALDDRWRWTIQLGHLVLQLTSRDRTKNLVTRELILATVLMLREFAAEGFTDLFVAQLWHESEPGLAVNIQLRVVEGSVDVTKIS